MAEVTRLMMPDLEATVARSASEALASLRSQAFDVMVTDYQMEGMDGLALTQQVHDAYPATAVIVASAVLGHETEDLVRRCGAVGVLPKPFGVQEFVAAIRAAVAYR